MRVGIFLYVVYDDATIPDKDALRTGLVKSIESAVSDGLLSPTGVEVIDEYGFDEDDITITDSE